MSRVAREVNVRSRVTIQCAVSSSATRRAVRLGEDPVVGLRRQADRFGYDDPVDLRQPVFPVWFRNRSVSK